MKKIIFAVLAFLFVILIVVVGLSLLSYKGYSGERPDLYTVAINSVLWNNGHSFSADRYADPRIEIIDEDIYGRTMFIYYEKYYAGAGISFSALVICQNSNKNEVFYYEDINYIVKEQTLYSSNIKDFEDTEIEQLKEMNDWNKEVDFDKCIRKKITKSKSDIPNKKEVQDKIVKEFHLDNVKHYYFVNFLTSDSVNSNYIIYGYIKVNNEEDIYFIGLVENGNESPEKINFLVPSNVFDYKTEFIEFKKINNWA